VFEKIVRTIASRSIAIEIALRTFTFEYFLSYVGNARNWNARAGAVPVAGAEVGLGAGQVGGGRVRQDVERIGLHVSIGGRQVTVGLEVDATDLRNGGAP